MNVAELMLKYGIKLKNLKTINIKTAKIEYEYCARNKIVFYLNAGKEKVV